MKAFMINVSFDGLAILTVFTCGPVPKSKCDDLSRLKVQTGGKLLQQPILNTFNISKTLNQVHGKSL